MQNGDYSSHPRSDSILWPIFNSCLHSSSSWEWIQNPLYFIQLQSRCSSYIQYICNYFNYSAIFRLLRSYIQRGFLLTWRLRRPLKEKVPNKVEQYLSPVNVRALETWSFVTILLSGRADTPITTLPSTRNAMVVAAAPPQGWNTWYQAFHIPKVETQQRKFQTFWRLT